MMRRLLVVGVIVLGLLMIRAWWGSTAALARPGIVHTTDGNTIEGDIKDDDPTKVTVTGKGGSTTIARDKVDHIDWAGNVEQEYKDRAAKLPKNAGAAAHVDLARWCFENKAYDLARQELDAALRIDPNNAEANTLYATVQSQEKIAARQHERPANGGAATTTPQEPGVTSGGPKANEHKYLSPEDINQIRQKEWTVDDNNVRVSINPDVKKKYQATSGLPAAEFNALSPVQQARLILKEDKPDLAKGVIINSDPAPIAAFKKSVQPILINTCATIGCHGGPNGGNFFLYPQNDNNDASYTNYFLLQSYSKTDAKGQKRLMVDRMYPSESLLLQYALPGNLAAAPHPDVPKGTPWHGVFKGADDQRYKAISQWMGESLNKFEPRYDINFSLTPATQPGK